MLTSFYKLIILHLLFMAIVQELFSQSSRRTNLDHALLIAVTDYKHGWTSIPDAAHEVTAIADELVTNYGFKTNILLNPSRGKIIEELNKLLKYPFSKEDQLLVFFSMHGYLNKSTNEGYLIPSDGLDARLPNAEKSWLSHKDLRDLLEKIPNVHLLTALDACYSGAFSGVKSRPVESDPCGDYCYCRIQQALNSPTRYYLTAGATEVVPAESKFAEQWLKALQSNGNQDGILTFAELYTYLEVVFPTPRWGTMNGHAQGNFIFISLKACNGAPMLTAEDPANYAMIKVDGGSFEMGDVFNEGELDEFPVHSVKVNDYWMDPTEVTFDTYDLFCRETSRQRPFDSGCGRGKKPVINVSWYDAIEFCNWRSQKMGLIPCYAITTRPPDPNNENQNDLKKWTITWLRSANGFRLPTEAEWEYASKSLGRKFRYGTGSNEANANSVHCNWNENGNIKTRQVGTMVANALGLYDMSGNVAEWCWDWYDTYYYSRRQENNPYGPSTGETRVVRGGNYFNSPRLTRTAARYSERADFAGMGIGFRCVRSK